MSRLAVQLTCTVNVRRVEGRNPCCVAMQSLNMAHKQLKTAIELE